MPVSKEQVLHTAALVRINLTQGLSKHEGEKTLSHLASHMHDVIGYMDIIKQADTRGVEPLYSPMHATAKPRADQANNQRTAEEILANAPEKHDSFFVVPAVL